MFILMYVLCTCKSDDSIKENSKERATITKYYIKNPEHNPTGVHTGQFDNLTCMSLRENRHTFAGINVCVVVLSESTPSCTFKSTPPICNNHGVVFQKHQNFSPSCSIHLLKVKHKNTESFTTYRLS